MKSCKLSKVLIISGVGNEVRASKRQDIERTRDATKFEIMIHKPQSFSPKSHTTPEELEIPSVNPLPLDNIKP